MGRSCARPACSGSATTTLSYDYAHATVWIELLHPEGHPMHHDLCERHAARLSVPRGWTLVDGRAEVLPSTTSPVPGGEPASPVPDAWDPSGSATRRGDRPPGHPSTGDGASVFEPTLFGDWAAHDDRHSLAS